LEKENSIEKPKVSKVKTIRQIIAVLVSWWLITTNTIFLKEFKTLSNYHKPEKLELVKLVENKVAKQDYETAEKLLELLKGDKNYNQAKVEKLSKQVDLKLHYLKKVPENEKLLDTVSRVWEGLKRDAKNFWEWFIGKSNWKTASTVWEITADFTSVWDVKDLYRQYKLYNAWKNVDSFIVWLSVLWIATTAVTIASLWWTVPAKIWVSITKKVAKLKKTPKWLKIKIVKLWEKVFENGKKINSYDDLIREIKKIKKEELPKLVKTFEKFEKIYKQTWDYKTTLKLVSKTKNAKELDIMLKLSKRFWKKTPIFLELWWDDFLKVYKKYGDKIDVKTYEKALKTKWGLKSLEKLGEKKFLKSFHKPHTRILKEIEKVFWKITDYLKAQIIALLTLIGEGLVFLYNLVALLRKKKK